MSDNQQLERDAVGLREAVKGQVMRIMGILGSMAALLALSVGALGCNGDDRPSDSGTGTVDAGVDAGEVVADAGPMGPCEYPMGPYGTSLLKPFEPFTLDRCDGTEYMFFNQEFCDNNLTVISIAAGWCMPCINESRQLTSLVTEAYRDRGVRVIQVLVQDEGYRAPTGAYCQGWVDRFGLTNIELVDPIGVTQIYFPGNSLPSTIIVDRNGLIRFRENGSTEGLTSLTAELDRLLREFP